MPWTMPPRVLQIVAALIVLAALSSFTLGVVNAPQRGRLPSEKPGGGVLAGAPLEATDATPLSQARIEGPPPPSPDAKAKANDDDDDQGDEADDQDQAPAPSDAANTASGNAAAPGSPPAAATAAGDAAVNSAMPPADEPPH